MTSADSRLLSVITHDLRNGLNAIHMTLHMIRGELPEGHEELKADVEMLGESVANFRRMLNHMTDYAQLFEPELPMLPTTFNPSGLLEEVVQEVGVGEGARRLIRLEVLPDCPSVVELEPQRVYTALKYALVNALMLDDHAPVHVVARGGDDRWLTTIHASGGGQPQQAQDLTPNSMERLLSNRNERRGLDLAIVARISAMLGGSARLEPNGDGGSALVLDWPVRIPRR